MWRPFNPNPRGLLVGDCTVRAICAVMGRDWRTVHRDQCGNVTSTAIISVPRGCCFSCAVENTSAPAAAGGAAPEINVQNANLTVSRIA